MIGVDQPIETEKVLVYSGREDDNATDLSLEPVGHWRPTPRSGAQPRWPLRTSALGVTCSTGTMSKVARRSSPHSKAGPTDPNAGESGQSVRRAVISETVKCHAERSAPPPRNSFRRQGTLLSDVSTASPKSQHHT